MKTILCSSLALLAVVACSSDPAAAPGAAAAPGEDAGTLADEPAEAGAPLADAAPAADADASATPTCSAARAQLLGPVGKIATGEVVVLASDGATRTLFVDASAGGPQGASQNPRVYLSLATGTKIDLTDVEAETSPAWDLAVKRPILFTNSGDAGPGQGGAVFLPGADFDAVTSADAAGKTLAAESFFDAECNAKTDPTGAVLTSFDGWYAYDSATNRLSPATGVWLVRGAGGALYKLEILSYYAAPDGGVGQSGGRFTMKVGAL